MRTSIYIRNIECVPSGYYRVAQYFKDDNTVKINNVCPKKLYILKRNSSKINLVVYFLYYVVMLCRATVFLFKDIVNKTDNIIVSKAFFPGITPLYIRSMLSLISRNSKIIWDFDDNIFYGTEISKFQKHFLETKSYKIIVANEFLKNKITECNRNKSIILPTTDGDYANLDIDSVILERKKTYGKNVSLVWVATGGNLKYLERILPSLDAAAVILKQKTGKQLKINIVCNKFSNYEPKDLIIDNIIWSRNIAIDTITKSHIGLMPLIDSEYTRGKAGFKLIQCMASGLPVITSNVGVNKDIVKNDFGYVVDDEENTDSWINAIINLSVNEKNYVMFSQKSYEEWKKKYSYVSNYSAIHNILFERD